MAAETNGPRSLSDAAFLMELVEEMGGAGAILDDLCEFREIVDRLWEDRGELMERYPDRWVAVGREGAVAVGDTLRAVLDEVERLGIARRDVVVDHLDPNSPVLIL